MSDLENNLLRYTIASISEFASKNNLSKTEAFEYLYKYKGLDFLQEFYDVEHTLSFEDAISDLATVCSKNGGNL